MQAPLRTWDSETERSASTLDELAGDERQKFERLLSRERYRKVKKMQLTWADKMKEEGRKEGKKDALLQLLTSKFGPLPEKTASRVGD